MQHQIAIVQLSMTGEFLKRWTSVSTTGRSLGLDSSSVVAVCRGREYSCGNFRWCYETDYLADTYNIRPYLREKSVSQFTKDNVLVKEWQSIQEASNTLGIDQSSISKACKGLYLCAGGFIWKYREIDEKRYSTEERQAHKVYTGKD